ncbi:phosphoethanolamine transferase [Brucella cytisi]
MTLAIITSLYIAGMFNQTFWQRVVSYFNSAPAPIMAVWFIVAGLLISLTTTFSIKYLIKPVLILLIVSGSAASWFTDQFGTIIDSDMIANAVQTTGAEAGNLLSRGFILHLLLTGLLPSLIICWVKVSHRPFLKKALYNLALIIPCLAIAIVAFWGTSRTLISTVREHHDLLRVINPVVPIGSAVKYALKETLARPLQFHAAGLDARIVSVEVTDRPRITIVVAGETARADNFSLQGYDRITNPELQKRDIIYFKNTTSCGTATAQSLPCMFSPLRRKDFSVEKAAATSSLPDILATAGVRTEWWDNNTGSKGVADRIKTQSFYEGNDPRFCIDGECQDDIMLEKLDDWLDRTKRDSVLFIHQLGSHGPAYFKRYPEAFRRFKPDCRGLDYSKCSADEVQNAYDNTILYTDHFLSAIIDKLQARSSKMDVALLYMSDHGESLGENGIYLHGLPYSLAPSQQVHIPFVLWFSPQFANSMHVDVSCIRQGASFQVYSHDNLFPSLLSMMNIDTSVKDESLDMFRGCRREHVAHGD